MERKGEGRALATAGASGWLCPSASPPSLGVLKSAPATAPSPCGCRQSSPGMDLFLCEDLGMKISAYIEDYIFYLIAVPGSRHAGEHSLITGRCH